VSTWITGRRREGFSAARNTGTRSVIAAGIPNPERERERARRYYQEHRAEVLTRAAARRGKMSPHLAVRAACEECGEELPPRRRVVCGERCREARFKRLHPASYAAREVAKLARRRPRRRELREAKP
jgi:hypothetical protein